MKTTTLLNRALFATALITVSTAAFANGGGSGPRGAHNAPYPYADGKTHAEVYQELLDAKESGEFARMKVAYKGH